MTARTSPRIRTSMQTTGHHCESPRFDAGNPLAERGIRRALWLTVFMMLVEIAGGWWFNSMAVLADGWHMSSHALALGLSAFAYAFARRHARNRAFAFGTWKIEILGGYTSAILLSLVAVLMVLQSVERLLRPQPIHYQEALLIAAAGLAVNLLCAWWLRDSHSHDHDHAHADDAHAHVDTNLRAAYLHVLADAVTSVLALVALTGGLLWGLAWLDPIIGLVGAALISVWAWGLLRDSGRILLDAEMDAPVVADVRETLEGGAVPARITDLHVWRVGRGQYAVVASVITDSAIDGDYFRRELARHEELVHVTVEVIGGSKTGRADPNSRASHA
jgi:cation diffusion facilitator family transporter